MTNANVDVQDLIERPNPSDQPIGPTAPGAAQVSKTIHVRRSSRVEKVMHARLDR